MTSPKFALPFARIVRNLLDQLGELAFVDSIFDAHVVIIHHNQATRMSKDVTVYFAMAL